MTGKVLLVAGSPSPHSRATLLLDYVSKRLPSGWDSRWLMVRELPPEPLLFARADEPAIAASLAALADADAVILSTPIYKAAYCGMLKCWLDLCPQFGLKGKTVMTMATGGSLAHALALDYALRPVVASMMPRHFVTSWFIVDSQMSRDPDGGYTLTDDARARLDPVIDEFVAALRPKPLP